MRRVYRATATYADPRDDTARHFLTKRARDRWAAQRRLGYEESGDNYLTPHREAIPPALRVETADSDPVTFS